MRSREIHMEDTAFTMPEIVMRQITGTLMLATNPAGREYPDQRRTVAAGHAGGDCL